MKFVRFGDGATGLLVTSPNGPAIVDVARSAANLAADGQSAFALIGRLLPSNGVTSWIDLIEQWDTARSALVELETLAPAGTSDRLVLAPLDSVRLLPPLPDPVRPIFALGGNFPKHLSAGMQVLTGKYTPPETFAAERSAGLPPWGFMILSDTVTGPGEEVAPPSDVRYFDYEGEVAVVLREGGRDLGADDVQMWGYTAWNDLSIRDPRLGAGPAMNRGPFSWNLEKNFDRGSACGPCMVVDEPYDVNDLRCVTRVNGAVRQDFSTAEMIWSFADAAAHISHYVTLKAGDMIASGTGQGVAFEGGRDGESWLKPGDVLELEVEGVGTLQNRVVDWSSASARANW